MDEINVATKKLDHLGIVAATIHDLGIIEAIDSRIPTSKQEIISTGEATAAMIMNGLGFTSEPLYMTPQFYSDKAINQLFNRDGLKPEHFNARKLGEALDDLNGYGLESLFSELAVEACSKEGIDIKYNSLDTTSMSLEGEYDRDTDEQHIKVVHGYSKDKRNDLKQIVHELLVSQDGGIPLAAKSWSGNASDVTIFRERSKQLITQFESSEFSNILVADSKLYTEETITNLNALNFITRVPSNIKLVNIKIEEAVAADSWTELDPENKYSVFELTHYGIEQRWVVVYSTAANSRANKRLLKKMSTELSSLKSAIKEINRHKLQNINDVNKLLKKALKRIEFHDVEHNINSISTKGNPDFYSVELVNVTANESKTKNYIDVNSCYIIGSNASAEVISEEIIAKYKAQNKSIENMAFRFIKSPDFFTSSLFVKSERRIESLLFIMTLSLLIYSIAQRKLRLMLEDKNETLPNQLNQPTQTPTMRWVFKMLNGINIVNLQFNELQKTVYEGIDKLKEKIITIFGPSARKIYGFHT